LEGRHAEADFKKTSGRRMAEGLMSKPRPVGVWLVLIYMICNLTLTTLLMHIGMQKIAHDPRQVVYQWRQTAFDHLALSLAPPIWMAAIILLFFLRKLAVPLLGLAFGLSVASMVHLALTTNWLELVGQGRYIEAAAITIDLAILLYAIRLARKGILY
jgi:hypothetical protein